MNENFTTFLLAHNIEYFILDGQDHCLIDGTFLDEFLQREENHSKHDFIRQNILNVTLNFNHRVREFIKTIITNKNSPCCAKFYNYRVEFQLRGAPHSHGTIWVDMDNFVEKTEEDRTGQIPLDLITHKGRLTKAEQEINANIVELNKDLEIQRRPIVENKVRQYNHVFKKIRNEELGIGDMTEPDQNQPQEETEMYQTRQEHLSPDHTSIAESDSIVPAPSSDDEVNLACDTPLTEEECTKLLTDFADRWMSMYLLKTHKPGIWL